MPLGKAILIDSFAKEVREIADFNISDYRAIYDALSHETMPVGEFEIVHLDDGDAIFVDERGLLHHPPARSWFKWRDYRQPLAGRGLILGSNSDGDAQPPKIAIDQVRERVEFLTRTGDMLKGERSRFEVPKAGAFIVA